LVEDLPAASLSRLSGSAAVVVVGSRELRPLESLFLGSVAAAVAAHAYYPVLVTRGGNDPDRGGLPIFVGVDGTETGEAAIAFGLEEADRRRVPLRAIACWHQRWGSSEWILESRLHTGESTAAMWMSEALAGWREKYPAVSVTAETVDDHPIHGLLRIAQDAQLLVVGRHRSASAPGIHLGSVSRGLLHHAPCPVAVVPAPGDRKWAS